MSILVTGGAGYIGSHTCLELLQAGYDVVVVDNLCNAKEESLKRVSHLAGREIVFKNVDIRDISGLRKVFSSYPIEAVVHFAGLKAVGESTRLPMKYYDNNVNGTRCLLEVMNEFDVRHLVFSSSATVYGDPETVPVREDSPTGTPTNPYGRTKLVVEDMLKDLYVSDNRWNFSLLRYFNPVGAHESGMIGEDPNGIPNNLMPFIAQVAVGKRELLNVYGGDYPTEDGTGIRDYIHVVDLAEGHLAALKTHWSDTGVHTYNLGTGNGSSVLEMLSAFEVACGHSISHKIVERRPGDIAECYADPSCANEKLGWKASRTIAEMTADTWKWQTSNPDGYSE
ncbi:UDP-galactose-4-epimerase [Endozoicomonas montiporae]|uniref:UDP-glucose 4-epimerase n=2 Tax=Endozoicomonas montiporae TaxID=1027273 RepID=A0A081N221_9GAMM|nr:UDP-glucose 4-epimerase GalE [Endozoicomonas montiporae]AMO58552.1 UDP-glucose 4-epimerase [Endozoicomonas montiporae CL-33]KEQ12494.1 UDP-galactose-4-epimerase [Endozoicomonas montiporae]